MGLVHNLRTSLLRQSFCFSNESLILRYIGTFSIGTTAHGKACVDGIGATVKKKGQNLGTVARKNYL